MDTLVLHRKKFFRIVGSIVTFSIITGLVFAQMYVLSTSPIFASEDLTLANGALVSPFADSVKLERGIREHLNLKEESEKFDKQIREKYKKGIIFDVDKGVKHIKLVRYYKGNPVKINVVEVNSNLNPDLRLKPALASDSLSNKRTITSIAQNNNAIVAINGTFFKPSTGVPLGTLMIDKKIYTGPIYDRVAMGIFDNGYDMARIQLDAVLKTQNDEIKVDNINQPRMLSTYIIAYTPEWGTASPVSPQYGMQVAIKDNRIIKISNNPLDIPTGGFVLVGPKSKLGNLKVSQAVNFSVNTIPAWKNVKHIISGGPYLVKDNEVYVDIKEQKLTAIGGRNPRTAVGYTTEGNLVIVTVDGREKASVGMTLTELASFMKSIGCYNAMNLDGGGSTVLYVNGKVANSPNTKGGIALSNALTLSKT